MSDRERRILRLLLLFVLVTVLSAVITMAIGGTTSVAVATILAAVAGVLAVVVKIPKMAWELPVIFVVLFGVAVGCAFGFDRWDQQGVGDASGAEQADEDESVASSTATTRSSTTSTTTRSTSTTTTTAPPDGYTDLWRAELMAECSADMGNFLGRCSCMVDWIADNVPFEDYKAYDEALEQDPNAPEPAWWGEMRRICFPGF